MNQLVFASILFAMLVIGFNYRLKANRPTDNFNRAENEGKYLFPALRLVGFSSWIVCLLYPIFPNLFESVSFLNKNIPYIEVLQAIGLIMAITALPMAYFVFSAIGNNITDTVETRANHQLITTGIYQYIRHPLYTTAFLLFNGLGLWSLNGLILLLSFITICLIVKRTDTEEQKLIERFGDDYVHYMQRTGRFFPFFRQNK